MKHECPGLRVCLSHPRWHILAGRFAAVFGPGYTGRSARAFYTFEEAINYAQQEAARDAEHEATVKY